MRVVQWTCVTFLIMVITGAAYRFGCLFLAHQWDSAAGWAGLLFGSNTVLVLVWALRAQRPPRARATPNRHGLKRARRVA